MRQLLALALCSLTACATCEEHPVICSVAASVAVSSIVTTIALRHAQNQMDAQLAAALAGGTPRVVVNRGPIVPPAGTGLSR